MNEYVKALAVAFVTLLIWIVNLLIQHFLKYNKERRQEELKEIKAKNEINELIIREYNDKHKINEQQMKMNELQMKKLKEEIKKLEKENRKHT